MTLQEIFDQLSSGELRKTNLGGLQSVEKGITPEHYPIIIPAINMAIEEVHKRLPLRKDSALVEMYDHITMYELHSRFAESNGDSCAFTKYIVDSPHIPFKDTVISIYHVTDHAGVLLPLNDSNDPDTVYTPTHNVVQHPYPTMGETFEVVYQAGIEKIPVELTIEPKHYHVDLPYYALAPVLFYVLSRIDIGMIRGDNVEADMSALRKFEAACQLIEKQSLVRREAYTNTQIHDNGWV